MWEKDKETVGGLARMRRMGDEGYLGGKPVLQAWNVVKGCAPEMISRPFKDHILGGQLGQLATGKLQGGSKHAIVDMLRTAKNSVIRLYKLKIQEI